jgi:hypothetical protein
MTGSIDRVPTDPLTLNFTGADHKALADALVSAFPTPEHLDEMLTARLDQPLALVAAPYPLGQAAFAVVRAFKARGHLLRLMASARASQPDNPALAAVAERFALATPTPPQPKLDRLEKIVKAGSQPFAVAVWRQRLERRELCVCRVEVPTSAGIAYGTGFLVSPTRVLTNHHVIAPALPGFAGPTANPSKIVLRFDYKELLDKTTVNPGVEARLAENWLIDSSPHSSVDLENPPRTATPSLDELDFALLELAEPVGSQPIPLGRDADSRAMPRGWIELRSTIWPFATESTLLIIQHPNGAPLSLAMDVDAKMEVNANQTRVTYQTGTEPGSSGSPCFNQYWDLVALHHAGDPLYPALAPQGFNEGIPIHRIVERLRRLNLTEGMTII